MTWRDAPVCYVAGPYRGATAWDVRQNIHRASTLALAVWQAGAVALCPHMNTAHFDGALPDAAWLAGDLAILDRCDALIVTDDWERSTGARAEVAHARTIGIPVFLSLDDLAVWLAARAL